LGGFTGNITVPDIWNGTAPVTAIDEEGNIAASDFTVFGSSFIPEALTFGVLVLLSFSAVVIATFSFRKRTKNLTT
jgi:hypothetical protein